MSVLKRRLRRTRFALLTLCAFGLIGMALVMGMAQLMLPWVVSHPEQVTAFLSEKLHRPVTIDRIEGQWERTGPVLTLHGLHLGAGDPAQQAMVIPQAALALNFFAWMHKNERWNEFRLSGLDLVLTHDAPDGSWRVHGLAGNNSDNDNNNTDDGDNPLFQLGSLVLRDVHLHVDDTPDQRQLQFGIPELRLINNGSEHRLLARVQSLETQSPPMAVVFEYDEDARSGRLYVGANQLDLAGLLRLFPVRGLLLDAGGGDAQFWVDWRSGALASMRAEVDLRGLVMQTTLPINAGDAGEIVPHVSLDRFAFGARLLRSAEGWRVDVADLHLDRDGQTSVPGRVSIEQRGSVTAAPTAADTDAPIADDATDILAMPISTDALTPVAEDSQEYVGSASDLDLSALASLSMLSDAVPAGLRQWLYNASPRGVAHTLNLRYRNAKEFDFNADVGAIAWLPVEKLPGVEGLQLEANGDAQAIALSLPAHIPVRLPMPQVFRSPIELADLSGTVTAYRSDGAWRIETPALQFEATGYGGELRGAVDVHDDGARPFMDVYALVKHAEVLATHQFWPYNNMPKPGVAWLDRGLAGGHLIARAAFRGSLADWPFRNQQGQFIAHADVTDATLIYNPEWPRVEHLNASADFLDTSLHVVANSAQSAGVMLSTGSADISDFAHAIVEVQLAGSGAGKNLLEFLNATPIGKRYTDQLRGVDIGGEGKLNLQLHLPLGNDQGPLKLVGTVDLADADLSASVQNLQLGKANGKVEFSERGFKTEDLAVLYENQPARFNLRLGNSYMFDPAHEAEANLQAKLPAALVLKRVPVLLPYLKYIQGSANWNVDYSVDDNHGSGDSLQRLIVKSDLNGIAINLPAPLHKDSGDIQALSVEVPLPFEGAIMQARLGDVAQMRARLEKGTAPFAGHLAFSAGMPDVLPKSGLRVSGAVVEADVSGWMDFVVGGTSTGGKNFIESVELRAAQLVFFGRAFAETVFKLGFAQDETTITLGGSELEGVVHIPTNDLVKRGITAQLAKLYLADSGDDASSDTTGPPTPAADALAGVNPAAIPPLHLSVGDFHLGHASFGDARVESYPVEGGMHIEQVQSHSPNIDMNARGDWLGRGGKDHSTFSIHFSAKNLGHMLDALGYSGVIDGGETVASIDASWLGAPSSFGLPKLDGILDLSVADGRIIEANTGGAGRILGLFSIAEIPRRLSMDFSDFLKSGMAFDSIKGKFKLANGNATTDDLQIKASAADIAVKGRTDLRAREFDQTMIVMPHLGNTLPIVGAIAGGPIGAAAGFVVQNLFRKPLNLVGEATYHVTGSWDKPDITLISKTSKPRAKDDTAKDVSKQK